ncbi:MFS sugar transporter-like protein [Rhizoctonia solani AG-3 Rhs1AP]|uniref:MFS sugar transporter-like protein n=2 Tax=Rhizoctonia solani AG-3 TaxID=1086053 RepID=A0A074S5Z1_9AGAM|nr:MFS sugar transporter-like protein [Rhizoctonia solani AG-3 Rhs1AP]KEP54654.1 MFS sugar transporter-like protein [Rhizoctonia solani 123E]
MSPSTRTDNEADVPHRERPTRTDSSLIDSETSLPRSQQPASALGQHITDEEIQKYQPRFRGARLNAFLAFIAGTGFTLFGYDQGVLSALLTTESFMKTFPQTSPTTGPPNHATLQSLLVAIYEIGCLIGALSNLWIGERLGRRRTIAFGGIIMIIGAILQTTSFGYAQMLVARVITGLGNGLNTSTVPAYHAECATPEKRGYLIMIEGSLITFGIMVSYWIDFGFFFVKNSSAQWRAPVALQIIFAIVMIIGVEFLPDSPRWLVNQGRHAEALVVISALEDKPHDHPDVQRTFLAIREAALAEHTLSEKGNLQEGFNLGELLHGGRSQNFRRATLGIVIQAFQQITGINLITYYATLLFERLGINDLRSRILAACNGTEYFLASLIAIWLIEKVGRRKLMIFGAVGQTITMVLLAVLGSIDRSSTNIASAVLLFVFNSFFAVGWLGMTWLYPAEITPLRIRQPANALSTASNWAFNFMVVMVTGPSFQNIGYHTYTVFACLNAFIIPVVYFYFPETAGKSLEDMDVVFAQAYNEGVSPVSVSLRKDLPPAGSPEADKILGVGIRQRRNNPDSSPNRTEGTQADVEKQG